MSANTVLAPAYSTGAVEAIPVISGTITFSPVPTPNASGQNHDARDGTPWSGALTIALVPLYVRLLGSEDHGLIGFFATLQVGFFIHGAAMTRRALLPVGDASGMLRDVLPIIAAALTTAAIGRAIVSGADFKGTMFPWLVVIGVVSVAAAAAASPAVRLRGFRFSRRAQDLH
jgi:hypothetical protein